MLRATATIALLLLAACSKQAPAAPAEERSSRCVAEWRELRPGLRHRSHCEDGVAALEEVEVDPRRWALDATRVAPTTAPAVARDTGATFAINANFFDPERKPLGVIVSAGKILQRPHPVSWQSIFYVTAQGKAAIVLPDQWPAVRERATMAVQAGPRLVVDGKVTGATRANATVRSGVCLRPNDRVVFFVTTGRLFDVHEISDLAASADALGCRDAMLFDGGPSAQMHLTGSAISIDGDRVPVFVIARPR